MADRSTTHTNSRPPMVLTRLWKKTSATSGKEYFVGRLGGVKVLLMENRDYQGGEDATHVLMVAEAADTRGERGGGGR